MMGETIWRLHDDIFVWRMIASGEMALITQERPTDITSHHDGAQTVTNHMKLY